MSSPQTYMDDTKPLLGDAESHPDFVFLKPGEADKWELVPNLDEFFTKIYEYYTGKGFLCIVLNRIVNLLIFGFIIGFSAFLLLFVDWDAFFQEKVIVTHSLIYHDGRRHRTHNFLIVCFAIFSLAWVWEFIRFLYNLKNLLEIKYFVNNRLNISEVDIENMRWSEILQRLINLQKTRRFCIVKDELTALDIVNRIMRKDNYLIAMMNMDVLDLSIPVPLFSTKNFLTKTMEWNIYFCLLDNIFGADSSMHKKYLNAGCKREMADRLRKILVRWSIINILLSPFIVVFLTMYIFFRYGEEIQSRPSRVGSRQWSPYACWKLREYNELHHIFQNRLNFSLPFAQNYIDNFLDYRITAAARLLSFVVGAMAAVLLLVGLLDESVLVDVHIASKSLIFFVGVFGTILAASRSFMPSENPAFDPDDALRKVVEHTHYFPRHWKDQAHTWKVRKEFSEFFQYRMSLFIQELIGVFITPLIMWYSLSNSTDKIVDFIRESTVFEEGVGHVCVYGMFDFKKGKNPSKEPTVDGVIPGLSKHCKMEKSFVNFKVSYPEWEPTPSGERLLENLQSFAPALPPLSTSSHESQTRDMEASGSSRGLVASSQALLYRQDRRYTLTDSSLPRAFGDGSLSQYCAALDQYYDTHLTPMELKEMGMKLNYDSNV